MSEHINYTIFNELKSELGENVFLKALSLVKQEITEAREIFTTTLHNKELEKFHRKAHSLKGSSLSFGFEPLGEILKKLEHHSIDHEAFNSQEIEETLNQFYLKKEQLEKEISKFKEDLD